MLTIEADCQYYLADEAVSHKLQSFIQNGRYLIHLHPSSISIRKHFILSHNGGLHFQMFHVKRLKQKKLCASWSRELGNGKLWRRGCKFGGAYIGKGLCMEGNLHYKISWAWKWNLSFLLCFTLYLRVNSKYKPPGGLYSERRFNGGFFALWFWGAYIWMSLFSEFYDTILTEKVPLSYTFFWQNMVPLSHT